jgi:hypothetical protein
MSSGCWINSVTASRIGSRRDQPARRGPLRGIRHRGQAARTQPMEVVCSYDRRACRHVRLGMQSRRSEIQGGARLVSPAVRQCLKPFGVAPGATLSFSADFTTVQEYTSTRALGAAAVRSHRSTTSIRPPQAPHCLKPNGLQSRQFEILTLLGLRRGAIWTLG